MKNEVKVLGISVKELVTIMDTLVLNCSAEFNTTEILKIFDVSAPVVITSTTETTKAAGFGAATGIFIAVLINLLLSFEHNKIGDPQVKLKLSELISSKTASRIIAFTVILALTPLVALILVSALLYKQICIVLIRRKDERFVKSLDSFDVFWSLEDEISKSIINVLGVIESKTPEDLVSNIKDKLSKVASNEEAEKLFYRRNEDYGFYYWQKHSDVDLDEYVGLIDHPDISDNLTTSDMEKCMSFVSRQPLPYCDQGLFQILVTKQRMVDSGGEKRDHGIIFRIHHSLGDGVALIEFLCKTLADRHDNTKPIMFTMPQMHKTAYNSPTYLLDMIRKICDIPVCFVDGILRQPDNSAIHGPALSGKKVFKWTESDKDLLIKVKELNLIAGLRFSDVLAAALSKGLHTFFTRTKATIPEDVAVVLPVRFPKKSAEDCGLKLENDFSVTILDLPTRRADVNDIQDRCCDLRKSADPITNYYFLKLVSCVLPKQILSLLLNSSQATMVFSNMPGPACLTLCGGSLMKSLVFFVPHKGTTGLGVTALSYGGVLRFAAMADTALVSSSEDLAIMLEAMVGEVQRLHSSYKT